jgi:vitamin K-dependent gamma-carboxylase
MANPNSFLIFRSLIGAENTDLFIVHMGGLAIDLLLGFFLYFDKTRKMAFFFGGSFHVMNSRIFSIGKLSQIRKNLRYRVLK